MRRLPLAALLFTATAFAEPPRPNDAAVSLLAQVLSDNSRFVKDHDRAAVARYRDVQHPRATVVACADSRFQSRDIEAAPEGDLFEIRNIGNQVDTAPGSVEYGVRHLKTPVLMVIGHVGCGAVKAALENYTSEHLEVRRELDGLHNALRGVPDGPFDQRWLEGVRRNVFTEVDYAVSEYAAEVKAGTLTIVGAVYDFRDELKGGEGRLHVIDINGERDPRKLDADPVLKAARERVK